MAENLQEMVLVCFSRAHGLYRVEDDEGCTLLATFASIPDPYVLAERIAQAQRQPVTVQFREQLPISSPSDVAVRRGDILRRWRHPT
jgi:hypothetical protein